MKGAFNHSAVIAESLCYLKCNYKSFVHCVWCSSQSILLSRFIIKIPGNERFRVWEEVSPFHPLLPSLLPSWAAAMWRHGPIFLVSVCYILARFCFHRSWLLASEAIRTEDTLRKVIDAFHRKTVKLFPEPLNNGQAERWSMVSSGVLRCVALVGTDVSEELSASFIRVTRLGELGTTLAVTSNRRTQRASVAS
jgi:hypothetical protein